MSEDSVNIIENPIYLTITNDTGDSLQVSVNQDIVEIVEVAIQGRNGLDGQDGQKGETGSKGDKGDRGEKGDKGDNGISPTINGISEEINFIEGNNISLDINQNNKTITINSDIDTTIYALKTEIPIVPFIPTNTSHLTNDSDFETKSECQNKIDYAITNLKDNVADDGNTLGKLRGLITGIQTILHSDDVNLDSITEIIEYIKNNKSLIDNITSNKINITDIVDDLIHTDTNKPLSANQGKILKDLIASLTILVNEKQDNLGYIAVPNTRTINGKNLSTNITITKSDLAIENVDNTSDINKPISAAVQNAFNKSNKKQTLIRSTGLVYGGEISLNTDNTKFDIQEGFGTIVDNYTDAINPISTDVFWENKTALSTPYLLTDTETYVYIDITGNVVLKNTYPTAEEMRDLIYVGYITHENDIITDEIIEPICTNAVALQLQDFLASFGSFNIEGNDYGFASNDLTVKRSYGKTFTANANYKINKKIPHIITTEIENPIQIQYYPKDTNGDWINDNELVNNIDPNHYETGIGLAEVPTGKWTIQLISYYAQTQSNDFQHGQEYYDSYESARSAIKNPVEINPYNQYNTFRGWLIVQQGCADLSDITKAEFISAGKLGLFDVVSGGGTGGEVNTASNIGVSGIGIFKDKIGVDLRFKKLNSASNKIILTDDSINNTVNIDVDYENLPINLVTQNALDNKVDKISGKGLSTEDFSSLEKLKLSTIEGGAEVNVQSDWNENNISSDAYIKNKPLIPSIDNLFNKLNDNTDDIVEGNNKFATSIEKSKLSKISVTEPIDLDLIQNAIDNKQNTLVSGTNIKTINGNNILGSGNIQIENSGVDLDVVKKVSIAMAIALS